MQTGMIMRDASAAARLFAGMTCLEGVAQAALTGMGRVWADNPVKTRCAVAAAGDFLLCGGEPGREAAQLLRRAMASDDREWLVHAPGAWADILAGVCSYTVETRYAFRHGVQPQDAQVRPLAALPAGVTVQPIGGAWIARCREMAWSRDFVREFGDDAGFAAHGMGVLLLEHGEPVAGASSYLAYPGWIEAQVQTREGCDGRGLATVAATQLILLAHGRGVNVSWDAANAASAHIAAKLGYAPAGCYPICAVQK